MKGIIEYWDKMKAEYQKKDKKLKLMQDHYKSLPYIKKMEKYLRKRYEKEPTNTDVACYLANATMLIKNNDEQIKFLKDFLRKNKNILSDDDKARIYTDLGFYEEYGRNTTTYLNKAIKYNSKYRETYYGMALYYHNRLNYLNKKEYKEKSSEYFKMCADKFGTYVDLFNYATSLYILKKYEEAKEIFSRLLEEYPDRHALLLRLAYCEYHLGNYAEGIRFLGKINTSEWNKNYKLREDDISCYDLSAGYYAMNEYDEYLKKRKYIYSSVPSKDDIYILYALWNSGQKDEFYTKADRLIKLYKECIEEEKASDEFDRQEEKQRIIEGIEKELKDAEKEIKKIMKGTSKLKVHLTIYPEYDCFLINCLKHKL